MCGDPRCGRVDSAASTAARAFGGVLPGQRERHLHQVRLARAVRVARPREALRGLLEHPLRHVQAPEPSVEPRLQQVAPRQVQRIAGVSRGDERPTHHPLGRGVPPEVHAVERERAQRPGAGRVQAVRLGDGQRLVQERLHAPLLRAGGLGRGQYPQALRQRRPPTVGPGGRDVALPVRDRGVELPTHAQRVDVSGPPRRRALRVRCLLEMMLDQGEVVAVPPRCPGALGLGQQRREGGHPRSVLTPRAGYGGHARSPHPARPPRRAGRRRRREGRGRRRPAGPRRRPGAHPPSDRRAPRGNPG